jgi:hypothetical protein
MFKKASIFCVVSLMLVGCGGNYGTSNNGGGGGGGGANYTGQAQGVYSGTSSTGYGFYTIVLPNDKFYGLYGTLTSSGWLSAGLIIENRLRWR